MRQLLKLLALLPLTVVFSLVGAATPIDPNDPAYLWDLSDLYHTLEEWSAARDQVQEQANKLDTYRDTLRRSATDMLHALGAISDVRKVIYRLYVYASLKADEDVKNAPNQERLQAVRMMLTTLEENTAWLKPEILNIGAERIHGFVADNAELKRRFGFYLDDALRYAPHTLGTEAEGVIAAASTPLGEPRMIHSQLADGELPAPTITLSDGSSARVDTAGYTTLRQSDNRADRKKVFDAFWAAFGAYQGTFGATLSARVMAAEFDAHVRRFPNALSDALFDDDMPEAVYRTLLAEADKNLPVLHRYLNLRKRALGITDDLQYYDIYPPIFELKTPPHYTVEESKKIALEVTAAYGPEYTTRLARGFAGRWMNVYPHPGKASGAYMNPAAYDVHPYLLFNNRDDYESLSTFVHEWGHAVHTLLAHDAQPFENAGYSIFIAETASTTNQLLLDDYMFAHAKTDADKLYFLGAELETIRSTFFRQAMFAKFQLAIHEELERGGALSGERMTGIYCAMLKQYYGEAQGVMKIDPTYCSEWAYIPHFYNGFYVFQYATSLAGAAHFAAALEKKTPDARTRFLNLLRAGGSDHPYVLYQRAGLDMASPAPYEALAARMAHLMDQIEAIQKKVAHEPSVPVN